eukprot:1138912-Pelagomonas_calceolata.AAC.1
MLIKNNIAFICAGCPVVMEDNSRGRGGLLSLTLSQTPFLGVTAMTPRLLRHVAFINTCNRQERNRKERKEQQIDKCLPLHTHERLAFNSGRKKC